jgi:predicted nucleic acid-binding protein
VKVIVDTCVWARFLRAQRDPTDWVCEEVRNLVRRDVVAMLGAIRQEVLSGAQPQPRFEQLKAYLRFFPNLPQDEEDDENAAACYDACRRHGVQGTATDLLICAVAVRHGMRIFTTDTDFEDFAKHLPITLHRERRRGANR